MREHLYRAKKRDFVTGKTTNEWVYGYLMRGANDGECMIQEESKRCHRADGETVGEYSGMVDKNGNRIFEGDILKTKTRKGEMLCVVVFRECWFIGITENNEECEFRYMLDVEVIGNIYDNPELWKKEKGE